MTPLGVRALSRPAVTAERHARVATLGRVFHQGRSSCWTRRAWRPDLDGEEVGGGEDVPVGRQKLTPGPALLAFRRGF